MGGVLELKAELYRAQEEARLNPQVRGRKKGPIEIRNAGVAERDRKDRAAIKVQHHFDVHFVVTSLQCLLLGKGLLAKVCRFKGKCSPLPNFCCGHEGG